MSCEVTAALVTRSAILLAGSASRAPSPKRSRWICSSIVRHVLIVVDRRAHEPQPRIQLVHVAVRGDARMALRDARAVEQTGVAIVAGPGVDFHVLIISPDCSGRHTNRGCIAFLNDRHCPQTSTKTHASRCRRLPAASGSGAGCSSGIAGTGATCRGGRHAIRIGSSCLR